MLYTLSHELTHYIKDWSPAKFKLLADFLMEQYGEQGQSVDELVQAQIRKAKFNGRNIDYDTAYEEVIADSMEGMLTDGKVVEKLQRFYKQDKTLFEKISDFINKWVEKVRQIYSRYSPNSKEGKLVLEMKDSLEELQSKFAEAIYAASENVTDSSKESDSTTQNPTSNLDVRYSIRTDSQGSYVKIDANQDVFNGKSIREMQRIACQLIKDNFKGKVLSVGANGRAYVNKHSAEEYAYPANRRMNDDIKEAKMRSSTELDNLLAISEFVENQPDDGRHLQATGGWDVYTTRFEVANTMFIGEVKIMVTDRGYVFYDITKIERLPVNGGQTEIDSAAASGNLSNHSILYSSPKSQGKNSGRDYSFDPELVADLQADADKLKSDVANLKELLKLQQTVTHSTVFTKTSVNAAASKLIKTFGMNQGKTELASALNEFYQFVASSEDLSWESVMAEAGKVADRVIELVPAREQRNDYSEKILKEIRNKGISLTDEQKTEIANKYDSFNNFRKSNMGSMILSDKGISLERQWQEWAELACRRAFKPCFCTAKMYL